MRAQRTSVVRNSTVLLSASRSTQRKTQYLAQDAVREAQDAVLSARRSTERKTQYLKRKSAYALRPCGSHNPAINPLGA